MASFSSAERKTCQSEILHSAKLSLRNIEDKLGKSVPRNPTLKEWLMTLPTWWPKMSIFLSPLLTTKWAFVHKSAAGGAVGCVDTRRGTCEEVHHCACSNQRTDLSLGCRTNKSWQNCPQTPGCRQEKLESAGSGRRPRMK